MNTNEFDELLRKKFEQHEFSYEKSSWDTFSKQLPISKKKRIIPFGWKTAGGIAAMLLLTIGGYTWWHYSHKTEAPIITKTETKSAVPIVNKTENSAPKTTELAIPKTYKPLSSTHTSKQLNNKIFQASEKKNTPDIVIANTNLSKEKGQNSKIENAELAVATNQNFLKTLQTKDNFNFNQKIDDAPKNKKSTSFSLTGGLNYGSLNNGYLAGINTKQVLGKKVFLEGDLAFMSNSSNQTITQSQFIRYQNATSVGLKPDPFQYVNTNYLYIQFNPTIGIQLMKKLAIGVGADVQTLLGNESNLVYAENQIKTLPGIDVGLTGKTEIALSSRIIAGLLYREGINNFINSSNNYLDRNYFQLQMKFRVFGK